mmetsp:Transcript_13880/g.32756  ORF Transcript_13880/g.32756 Transcript_13880/m.32756 type:complete len:219 (+) Transcript_13880:253-909(+)
MGVQEAVGAVGAEADSTRAVSMAPVLATGWRRSGAGRAKLSTRAATSRTMRSRGVPISAVALTHVTCGVDGSIWSAAPCDRSLVASVAPAAAVDPVTAPAGALVVGDTAFLLPGFGLLGAGLPGFAGALGGPPDDGRGVEGGVRSGEWQGEGAPQAVASMGAGAAAPTASRAVATAPPRTHASRGGTALPISTNARDHAPSNSHVGGKVCSVAASRTV